MDDVKKCHDCGVEPGEYHQRGCDLEQCPHCGMQLIAFFCDCEVADDERMKWTGEWPGKEDCRRLGLWRSNGREDLNALAEKCRWDREAKRWEAP